MLICENLKHIFLKTEVLKCIFLQNNFEVHLCFVMYFWGSNYFDFWFWLPNSVAAA